MTSDLNGHVHGQLTIIWTERGLAIAGTHITSYDIMDSVTGQYPPTFIRAVPSLTDEQVDVALPVITMGNIDRLLAEPEYRDRCAHRLVDIVVNIEDYRGARRIFIP